MEKRTFLMPLLLISMFLYGLAGCGGKDETPPAANTSQQTAMVPDSVVESEDPADVQPVADIPAEMAAPQAASSEHPHAGEPAAEVKPVEAPAQEAAAAPPPPPSAPAGNGIFSLQLGSYTIAAFAEEKAAQLRDLGHPATVEEAEVGGQLYHRVFIRGLDDRQSAEKLGEELRSSLGLSYLIRRK